MAHRFTPGADLGSVVYAVHLRDLALMIITLSAGVTAELADGPRLAYTTRFDLADLSVRSRAGADSALVGSRGPLVGPHDVMLFAADSGALADALLFSGDPPSDPGRDLSAWLAAAPVEGVLRLKEPRDFRVPHVEDRQYTPDGGAVGYFLAGAPMRPADPARARIAPGVDLLLERDRYVGWAVVEPERYLADLTERPWPGARAEPADPELGALIARYFGEIRSDGETLGRLQDQDPRLLAALRSIRRDLDLEAGAFSRRAVLQLRVDQTLDFYFGWPDG